jgi:hypothetical protein
MKWLYRVLAAVMVSFLLAGCNQWSKGSSAAPPTDVKAVPGDGVIVVTWTMASNVEYWLFYGPTPGITTTNWTDPGRGAQVIRGATSPAVFSGLVNGTTYSFTINGRTDGGPGGDGSPSISAVPRLAGAAWTVGGPIAGLSDLHGVTYGAVLVAAGAGGALLSSPDGTTWTAPTNPAFPANLNAVLYGGNYLAAGAGGVMLFSADATTWIQEAVGNTANELTALASNGSGGYVAVGKGGTIVFSTDGQTWSAPITAAGGVDLYGVTYGNGMWIAVGDVGTLLTSADGTTWIAGASNTVLKLKGVTHGVSSSTGTNLFVAVGAAGTVIASSDGVTWTALPPITGSDLNAVTYGRQFVAVGDTGSIFTSTDGTSWQVQTSGTSSNLNAVTPTPSGFFAVGAAGTNVSGN